MSRIQFFIVTLTCFVLVIVFWQTRLPMWSAYDSDASLLHFHRRLGEWVTSKVLSPLDRLQLLALVPDSKKDKDWSRQVRDLYKEGQDLTVTQALLEILPFFPEAQRSEWLLRLETHPNEQIRDTATWTHKLLPREKSASTGEWLPAISNQEGDLEKWMEGIFQAVLQKRWTDWVRYRQLEQIGSHAPGQFAEHWLKLLDASDSSAETVELALKNLWKSPIWTESLVRDHWPAWSAGLRLMILRDLFQVCPEWRTSFLEMILERETDEWVLRGLWKSLESANSPETRAWTERFLERWQHLPRHKSRLEFQIQRMQKSPDLGVCR